MRRVVIDRDAAASSGGKVITKCFENPAGEPVILVAIEEGSVNSEKLAATTRTASGNENQFLLNMAEG